MLTSHEILLHDHISVPFSYCYVISFGLIARSTSVIWPMILTVRLHYCSEFMHNIPFLSHLVSYVAYHIPWNSLGTCYSIKTTFLRNAHFFTSLILPKLPVSFVSFLCCVKTSRWLIHVYTCILPQPPYTIFRANNF